MASPTELTKFGLWQSQKGYENMTSKSQSNIFLKTLLSGISSKYI